MKEFSIRMKEVSVAVDRPELCYNCYVLLRESYLAVTTKETTGEFYTSRTDNVCSFTCAIAILSHKLKSHFYTAIKELEKANRR